ncbi:hypothetical protein SRABI83_00782 [Arthrobacter sp. Bi83]|jgi:hypothetical protein|uniref:hypothetical protein n=1 Tax=Arthrobacter sp. Bi83 TaxID=2822353 RepID=UPI001E153E7C|nr:hypothetical protein [Arthrobacter sp. Bi83]CAH0153850.1 hypothetical protein SRABI83_00782 [Arthrobacter sp. Bi83]
MLLWSSLTLFLDSRRNDDDSSSGGGKASSDFPRGQLTSTAWEGWWHDDVAS